MNKPANAATAAAKPAKAPKAKPAKQTPPAAPAQAVAPATPKAKPAKAPRPALLSLGREFVAKAEGKYAQAENWAVVQKVVPCSYDALATALKEVAVAGGYSERANVIGFIGGRIRGGNLV